MHQNKHHLAPAANVPDGTRHHEAIVNEIIKRLTRIARSGHRQDIIFRDWLTLVDAGLTSQQALADNLSRLSETYRASSVPEFIAAMEMLKSSVDHGYYDTVGDIYMYFAYPNPHTGQFFTPWPVAQMMGMMTIGDGKKLIEDRLTAAAEKATAENPAIGTLMQLGAFAALTCCNMDYLRDKFLPAVLPYYEPLTVCDPCVGSGVMLLGTAAQFPDWAIHAGLVQFYGMDIDPDCVQMCKINVRLYGLNGSRGKYLFDPDALKVGNSLVDTLPLPAKDFYLAARKAHQNGDADRVQEFIDEANRVRQQMVAQTPLFAAEPAPAGLPAEAI